MDHIGNKQIKISYFLKDLQCFFLFLSSKPLQGTFTRQKLLLKQKFSFAYFQYGPFVYFKGLYFIYIFKILLSFFIELSIIFHNHILKQILQ